MWSVLFVVVSLLLSVVVVMAVGIGSSDRRRLRRRLTATPKQQQQSTNKATTTDNDAQSQSISALQFSSRSNSVSRTQRFVSSCQRASFGSSCRGLESQEHEGFGGFGRLSVVSGFVVVGGSLSGSGAQTGDDDDFGGKRPRQTLAIRR